MRLSVRRRRRRIHACVTHISSASYLSRERARLVTMLLLFGSRRQKKDLKGVCVRMCTTCASKQRRRTRNTHIPRSSFEFVVRTRACTWSRFVRNASGAYSRTRDARRISFLFEFTFFSGCLNRPSPRALSFCARDKQKRQIKRGTAVSARQFDLFLKSVHEIQNITCVVCKSKEPVDQHTLSREKIRAIWSVALVVVGFFVFI